MKKIVVIATLLIGLSSCQKDGISPVHQDESPSMNVVDSLSESVGSLKSSMTGYNVIPSFGKPNSTQYVFQVHNPSGTVPLSVKLCERATGAITYLPMTKVGSNWTLTTTLALNGWFDWRYVYSASKANISNNTAYVLCNSRNVFSSTGTSSISWPFGADGSHWSNRTPNGQKWNGGQENNIVNSAHSGISEQYSDDWNRGTGSQDLGAIIYSPLDGYIETISTYTVPGNNIPSKYVSIIQQNSNGTLYRFYVGHLQNSASGLYPGKFVRAGIDQIGTLGMSGASSPHAHTNLRISGSSVKFSFNAQ